MNKENKIKELILEILEEDSTTLEYPITLDSHLKNDIGLDSLNLALLTVKIEDEFNIDIFEKGLVFTVSDILDRLNE
tara:strand:- start:698 stop:928 length:231 start_codon:yes stop_codon:yes gene_type:complete